MTPQRLEDLYSRIIHDVLRTRELTSQVLPCDIRPLIDGLVAAGPPFPAEGRRDSRLSTDDSLLTWTESLAHVPSGCVVMLVANDDDRMRHTRNTASSDAAAPPYPVRSRVGSVAQD